ncbi:MAG TPA: hypothetical protein VKW04_14135 [Planctomycetota bacterium]|jgi:hypothetical protein|nr:hypothetical protein [Planctomycetota bacterium]
MMNDASGPKRRFHVLIGTPDGDQCPICRAHAMDRGEAVADSPLGPVHVQELTLSQILRCPCPLCVEAREDDVDA